MMTSKKKINDNDMENILIEAIKLQLEKLASVNTKIDKLEAQLKKSGEKEEIRGKV